MNELLTKGIGHTEFKDSELGRIPKNWIIKNFSEVTSLIKSGLSRKLSHQDIGLPIINSGNITKDGLDTTELKYWYLTDPQGENTENYFLDEGDILLNFINSISQIGKSCIFRDIGRSTIYTTNIFRIKSNKFLSSKFLFLLMNHDKFQKEIQLITKPAVNQASFTKDELLKIRVQVPPIEEQKKIENIIFSLDDEISTITKKFNKYFFLKKSLMQDLLTGKVRVSVN
jgi:type I restriction enzyme S subunit